MARTQYQRIFFDAVVVLILILPAALYPQRSAVSNSGKSVDANRLAEEVIQNELNAQTQDQSLWKYHEVEQKDGKRKVFEVVQTKSGEIQRLVAVNDGPLSPKERSNENRRIQRLLADQREWQEKQKSRNEDAEHERNLLAMLPAAFRYEYDGMESGLMRLRFKPNPNFHPKSREGEVFHHMEGVMWVEPRQKRMAELDGRLLDQVKFGGGLLGHLNAGGTFSVRQTDVGDGHWEMTLLDVKMDGKALFFKTIAVREKEVDSNFKPLPSGLSLEQAAEILRKDAAS